MCHMIRLLILLSVFFCFLLSPCYLKLIACFHSLFKILESQLSLIVVDLCLPPGFLIYTLTFIILALLIIEEVKFAEKFRGPEPKVSISYTIVYNISLGLVLLRSPTPPQYHMLFNCLLLVDASYSLTVFFAR